MNRGVVIFVAVLVAANVAVYASMTSSAGPREVLWDAMESTKLPERADLPPEFSEAVRAKEGERVTLSGVAFVTPDGVRDGRVAWCVLMPASRMSCCGVSCDPRPQLSVYVDCGANAWDAAGRDRMLATVEGTLRLDRDGATWCLYALDGAVVRPIEQP